MSEPLWQHPLMHTLSEGALRPGGLERTRKTYDTLALPKGAGILDAGCGTGVTGAFLQKTYGVHVTAIDISQEHVMQARAKGISALRGRIENLPFAADTFSVVNCDCVLSLATDIQSTLQEFNRVLLPEGLLVLSDLYRRSQSQKKLSGSGCEKNALSLSKLEQFFATTNFTLLKGIDCTKDLKELTAKLIFAGVKTTCNSEKCTTAYNPDIGYIQLIAGKKG